MRAHLLALGMSAVLLLGACGQAAADGSAGDTVTAPQPSSLVRQPPPAGDAGGACLLMDYGLVDDALGIRFDVAAGGRQDKTYTCVLRSSADKFPDLLLTLSPTTADKSTFRSEMAPKGAKTIEDLGKAAYRSASKAGKGGGPAAEVGWLTSDKRLITLRLTMPEGTPLTALEWQGARLVELAKNVDRARD